MNVLLHTTAVQPLPCEQGFPGREAWLDWERTHLRLRCMMPGLKLRIVLERHEVQSQKTQTKACSQSLRKGQEWQAGACQERGIEKGQRLSRGRSPIMDGATFIGPRVGGAASMLVHFLFTFNFILYKTYTYTV